MDTLYFLVEEQIYVYREISKILLSNFFPFLVFHVTVLFSRKHQYLLNKQKSLKINEGTRFVNNQCTFLKYIYIFFFLLLFSSRKVANLAVQRVLKLRSEIREHKICFSHVTFFCFFFPLLFFYGKYPR